METRGNIGVILELRVSSGKALKRRNPLDFDCYQPF